MYFNQKVKPFRIACVLKISRNRVYREVEQAKRDLIVLKYERREREKLKRKIWVDVKTIIEEFWDERENIYFTIDYIIKHLSKKVDSNEVPSWTYIGHYLKNKLGLSYKKVSWRPKKIQTPTFIRYKLDYISFIEQCETAGYLILQIDEFTVNRNCASKMAWVKKNKAGYVVSESSNESYSVIAAITDNNLELVAIRKGTTNQYVFCEFINQLSSQLLTKYNQDKKRFILTTDGAKYHWTENVKNMIKNSELMMIQTVAYSPEFSPVEIFINWVKGHIRKFLRNGK